VNQAQSIEAQSKALTLRSPIDVLRGVGPRMAERLQRLGLIRVCDLLLHLPLRYQDRTQIIPIGAVTAGNDVLLKGEVLLADVRYVPRRMLVLKISDGTGMITVRFFNFSKQQQQGFIKQRWFSFFGEVRNAGRKGQQVLDMVHPEYSSFDVEQELKLETHLTPVYPVTEGVGQATIRKLATQALQLLVSQRVRSNVSEQQSQRDKLFYAEMLTEWLPDEILQRLNLPPLPDAVALLHRPLANANVTTDGGLTPAQQRLAFEELLVQQLTLRRMRSASQQSRAPILSVEGDLQQQLLSQLPFDLTAAQDRVVTDIDRDLRRNVPMMRLVQGDVGSGKTIVAAHAMLRAVESGFQAALMAPTELLAEQHFRVLSDWLKPLGIEVAWLSGKIKGHERRDILERIVTGDAAVVIGTHALFQQDVIFSDLALVVIDEQHRFGVHQRHALREKGREEGLVDSRYPHQLIMTATPIPRTLVMTAYADLDVSVIDELPPGRQPVATAIIAEERREEVLERVRLSCCEGRQAYWVCTLVEESEVLQCQAAQDTAEQLTEQLAQLTVGLVHGRMKSQEKQQVMAAFKAGKIDVLVATTVIEVGVDVPNASLMIIENAERLGLAQLHQLRGRVGRGVSKSSCVLLYRAPLSERGRKRLTILRDSNDGFEIARRDLEMRGPGEVLGTRQAGLAQFRVADLMRDQAMIPDVSQTAELMLSQHPQRVDAMIQCWHGDTQSYSSV